MQYSNLALGNAQIFLAFLSFIRNFAIEMAKLLCFGIKKKKFFCSALDFS